MAAAGVAALLPTAASLAKPAAAAQTTYSATGYVFFTAAEARFIEPACARLIPADATGPGALEVGACLYVDAQLAGPWGAGRMLHRTGAWQPGTPIFTGTPVSACTPARFVRTALRAIEAELHRRGTAFDLLPTRAQDAFLADLRRGAADRGAWSHGFFDLLLQLTVEGFFSSPRRAAPRDRIPWRLSGFPGAFAARS